MPPQGEPALTLRFPVCPSTNNLFANRRSGGRTKTPAYRRWQDDAGWAIKLQRPTPVPGRIAVLIELPSARMDVDNIKPVLDLLSPPMGSKKTGLSIIGDDRLVDDLRVVRVSGADEMMVVSIWRL